MAVALCSTSRTDEAVPPSRSLSLKQARVLIVSPHFPPINAADHHRVRLALPHLSKQGWSAEVLTVRPEDVEGVIDPDLAESLPRKIKVHRVRAFPARWTRRVGIGNVAFRAYWQLKARGDNLLTSGKFDLVFFSTTQFGILVLGPYWKKRHGVPYVVDFQDEWVGNYYRTHSHVRPPGGRWKYGAIQWIARRQEQRVVRQAAQIVSVSPSYNERLRERHPGVSPSRFHVLPFGGESSDFKHLDGLKVRQNFFDPADGRSHWVYVGRGGADMRLAASALFLAVKRALAASFLQPDSVRIHLIGTSYAPAELAQPSFVGWAKQHALSDIVSEHPGRVPYFTALRCLRDASAVLVFGSDDKSYTASKIFPAVLTGRPLLGIIHEESSAAEVLRRTNPGSLVSFKSGEQENSISQKVFARWISGGAFAQRTPLRANDFSPFTAEFMARRLCVIFDIARGKTSRNS